MSEPFIGQIALFTGTIPRGWAECRGQLLPVNQNQALFSLLGTRFGGDGRTNFGLPDLRGRVPVHFGTGPGLGNYSPGQKGGAATVTLTEQNLPPHAHELKGTGAAGTAASPAGALPAAGPAGAEGRVYGDPRTGALNAQTVGASGQSQPHNNLQPSLAARYAIALQGIYPTRS